MLGGMGGIRVAEVLAALSLTTDLASGVPFEKGLRTCAVATAFGRELGLGPDDLPVVYHTGLVRAIGCTAHATENAEAFGDDIAFQGWLKEVDLGDEAMLARQLERFGAWEPARQAAMTTVFLDTAPTEGTSAWRSSCEVGRAVGPLLGLPGEVVTALDHVYERWDGRGIPGLARREACRWRPGSCTSPSRPCWRTPRPACPARSPRSAARPAGTWTRTWPARSPAAPGRPWPRWPSRTSWPRWCRPSRARPAWPAPAGCGACARRSGGAQGPDDRGGLVQQADGAAPVVVDAAAGAVAAADDEDTGTQLGLQVRGQPAHESAVVQFCGEVEGEDPELLGRLVLPAAGHQAAPALAVPDHGQGGAGERRRLICGELLKAPDAVVDHKVGEANHTAKTVFCLLRGLHAHTDQGGSPDSCGLADVP